MITTVADPPVVAIRALWHRFRYLIEGGLVVDVISPYRSNSDERSLVLQWAKAAGGGEKIVGAADLGPCDPPAGDIPVIDPPAPTKATRVPLPNEPRRGK